MVAQCKELMKLNG
uniref:Uncharacterized protein n=1 Tax=Arundo donax TaxID=35708 RepID=A0A0A9F8V3_ARUDO